MQHFVTRDEEMKEGVREITLSELDLSGGAGDFTRDWVAQHIWK